MSKIIGALAIRKYLNCSESTLMSFIVNQELPVTKISGEYVGNAKDLDKWLGAKDEAKDEAEAAAEDKTKDEDDAKADAKADAKKDAAAEDKAKTDHKKGFLRSQFDKAEGKKKGKK